MPPFNIQMWPNMHYKLTISQNFNKIGAKIVKNMFAQNPCASKCKNDMKNIYITSTQMM